MSLNTWYLLGVLLLSVFGDCEIFDGCGYRLKLEPEKRLRIVSPAYPDRYASSLNCLWHITSDTRVRLTCEEFDLSYKIFSVYTYKSSLATKSNGFQLRHEVYHEHRSFRAFTSNINTFEDYQILNFATKNNRFQRDVNFRGKMRYSLLDTAVRSDSLRGEDPGYDIVFAAENEICSGSAYSLIGKGTTFEKIKSAIVFVGGDDIFLLRRNCETDVFEVRASRSVPAFRYCDRRDFIFSVESEGNEMTITLKTDEYSPGGLVNCYAEAFEDEHSCKCGWKSSPRPSPLSLKSRILGGTETRVNEYPMMAAIMDTRFFGRGVVCGGTIISKKHVLTAAHGLVGFKSGDAGVLVGDHDLTRSNETASSAWIFKVLMFYPHPLYKNTDKKYDIAIVLTGTMTFSNTIGPACLPFNLSPDIFEGSPVEILGWGTTEVSGAVSDTLLKARVVAQNYTHCKAYYPDIDRSQMCTYSEDADACQHDSGGPVLWEHPVTRRLVIIGIISYGTFCGTDKPGVNTFVGAHLDWIRETLSDVKYCKHS